MAIGFHFTDLVEVLNLPAGKLPIAVVPDLLQWPALAAFQAAVEHR